MISFANFSHHLNSKHVKKTLKVYLNKIFNKSQVVTSEENEIIF